MNPRARTATGGGRPAPPPRARPEFTIEEHLRVQRQIEQRAYCHWRKRSGESSFNDWLNAETEVLAEFAAGRINGRHLP